MWVRVGLVHGELALHQQAYGQAISLMDALYGDLSDTDIWCLRPEVLHLKELAQGPAYVEETRLAPDQARAKATKADSLRTLWTDLVSLSEVATCRRRRCH